MKLRLIVVGKMQTDYAACEQRYRKRFGSHGCELQLIELSEGRGKQSAQRKQEEERQILQHARAGYILFDACGKARSSVQWADTLQSMAANATQDFVIGGTDGVSASIRQQAAQCWSLSALTLPHQMARLLVVEQLYRAWTIVQGHPYHRV
ncbi:MAG: 23S rRNA (pseudouridine(1915)-N(3))-methyltransferase RlmH [Mariprofundaceae bacterium]|nr:23S rRNA (pseudouridine(1915)-N(3))-methyltransferase RlmH [Mariprofundaceae bacterium]